MAAIDLFSTQVVGGSSPATHIAAVTPDDDNDLEFATRALLASADCTIKADTVGGETVEGIPVQKGYNPLRVTRIYSTGTTLGGADLFALW